MTYRLITPPAVLAVPLADAKANLRITANDQDMLITAWIEGITSHAEHLIGSAIINQTWRVTIDAFPDAIQIPPNTSTATVKYLDSAGVEQTLNPADYVIDTALWYIVPAPNKAWPETYDRINSVNVDVVCGFGAAATDVPKEIKLYLLAKLSEQFDGDKPDTVQASFIDSLLDRSKTYSL